MPEPREPMAPPEPDCTCCGWPGSVCAARRAAARVRLRRWLTLAWAGAGAIATVLLACLDGPTTVGTVAAAVWGASAGIELALILWGAK